MALYDVASNTRQALRDGLLIAAGAPYCVNDPMALPYRQISSQISLLCGQGPVGQAYEKGTMIW
jgi:hypothetical protein